MISSLLSQPKQFNTNGPTIMREQFGIFFAAVSLCALFPSASPAEALPVPNRVRNACDPLEYGSLRLQGYLGRRIADNTRQELLVFPLDTYLWPYAHGGKPNGKWGADEFAAKYLITMTVAYQSETAAVRASLKQRMDRIKDAWLAYQKPDGFCLTRKDKDWEKPEWEGEWDTWNARYLLLGMIKYYECFHDAKVLGAAKRLADSFLAAHGPGKLKLDKVGGVMMESMVLLYRTTGDTRYLDNCRWMMESKLRNDYVDELVKRSGRVDRIPDCHCYVVLSGLAGILDLYLLEGGPKQYLDACRIAVDDIVKNRWYVTGGMGEVEFFRDNQVLSGTIPDLPQEACAAAYFMALCRKLFWLTGDPRYVDYLETSLYNNGLGSKNPRDSFLVSYYSPLQGRKTWLHTDHTNGTPCCTCSMCRELARIPDDFAARWNEGGVCLLLYNPGSLHCPLKAADGQTVEVALDVEGDYPAGGRAKVFVRPSRPASFRLSLRVPAWCNSFRAAVNGQSPLAGAPGTFLHIDRRWSADDRVEVEMDVPVRVLQGGESYPNCVALRRGPQVLAVDSRLNFPFNGADKTGAGARRGLEDLRIDLARPVQLVAEPSSRLPAGWVGTQVYSTPALGGGKVLLVPYADAGQMSDQDRFATWIRIADGWKTVDDPELRYAGSGWKVARQGDGHFGGSAHYTTQPGDSAEFTFTGTGVELYGYATDNEFWKDRAACRMDVYLNGQRQAKIDYAAQHTQRRLFVKTGLPRASYTLKIVCTGGRATVDYVRYEDHQP